MNRILQATSIATGSFIYFIIALALLHVLVQDFDPTTRFMSEYAVGEYGFLMTSAFLALSLGSFCLIFVLRRTTTASNNNSRLSILRIALRLLFVWSVCVLLAGLCTTDLQETETISVCGMIHGLASLTAFVCMPIATILLAFAFRQDAAYRASFPLALGLGVSVICGLGVFVSSFARPFTIGLNQRIYVGTILLWLLSITALARRVVMRKSKCY